MTVIVEKQQIQLLSASILELMANLDLETGPGPDEDQMALEEPIEAQWRAGRLSIGFDRARDLFVLDLEEYRPEDEAETEAQDPLEGAILGELASVLEPETDTPQSLRLWATKEQMFALSRHGATVAGRGRPVCQFCGNSMDPEGHSCPAMNGHSRPA